MLEQHSIANKYSIRERQTWNFIGSSDIHDHMTTEVFLMAQKAPFPRGVFSAPEKMCFDDVNGAYFY
jgi:hypothetical protein